jgi:ADP-ribose pyrophosphatase
MSDKNDLITLHAGRHLSLVARGRWEFATRPVKKPAVGIVAITDEDRVVLVEQFRVPVEENVIELPAGLTGDVAGAENESLLESAKRELREETGYEASRWSELASGYSSPGLTDETIVLFLAEGVNKCGRGGGDQSEDITVHEVSFDHVMAWLAERGAKADMKLLAGLFAAQEFRNKRPKP